MQDERALRRVAVSKYVSHRRAVAAEPCTIQENHRLLHRKHRLLLDRMEGIVHRSLHLCTFEGLVESDGVIARGREHRRHAQARHRSPACLDDGFLSVRVRLVLRTGGAF